ncbi:hypothetical protein FF098_013760 [Parvularcula flava]|uniref:Uncharacterized protein n=1 Tax=Aquisalinus luteolus TaxID=1566827 RepID=A0ABX0HLR1_9PROT|nr:hypothetical protein [Aquisalinus luteolus]NHK28984.1 hypothetical protein [Aquisalinus luteolus]
MKRLLMFFYCFVFASCASDKNPPANSYTDIVWEAPIPYLRKNSSSFQNKLVRVSGYIGNEKPVAIYVTTDHLEAGDDKFAVTLESFSDKCRSADLRSLSGKHVSVTGRYTGEMGLKQISRITLWPESDFINGKYTSLCE